MPAVVGSGMDATQILLDVFRFLHFVGLAALLGGLLVQIGATAKRVTAPVLWGAVAQLVTGLALLVLTIADANHLKVTVKLVILAAVLVIALVLRRRDVGPAAYATMLALTLVDVGLAVFW